MKLFLAGAALTLCAVPAFAADEAKEAPLELTTYANGWAYGEPGNSCIARMNLPGKRSVTIRLTNWDGFDGRVNLEGAKLPAVPEGKWGSNHPQILEHEYDEADPRTNWVQLKPEFTQANFPDTALFLDGKLVSRLVIAEVPEGKKRPEGYYFHVYQPQLIEYLRAGQALTIIANGKKLLDIPVAGSAEMAARMKTCATRYSPDAG